MGNNRRNWHREWSINLAGQTTTHSSGLVVQFVNRIIFPQPEIGTHCVADGIGEWTGFLTGGDDVLVEWMRKNPNVRDAQSFRSRLGRLMEEAGRVWAKAKKNAQED